LQAARLWLIDDCDHPFGTAQRKCIWVESRVGTHAF